MVKDNLVQYFPAILSEAEEIDYDALAFEIGKAKSFYTHPTTPEGESTTWLDKLDLCQETARYIRDGGAIDLNNVIVTR